MFGKDSRILASLCIAGFVCLSTGCSTAPKTSAGAGIGGAIGTGAGLAIGAATGNPKTGALAGGLLGAGIGGAVGADADARDREQTELRQAEALATAQTAVRGPLTMNDVIQLTSQGVGDDVIVNYIQQTGSTFQLTPTDIGMLKNSKVSDRVINEMISSRSRVSINSAPQKTVVIRETMPPPVIVYERPHYWHRPCVYAPPPPPPVGVGLHFHSVRVK